jgi:nucleotide-binding universal stress UspA family protein
MLRKRKPKITLMHVRDTDDLESQEFADACVLKGETTLKKLDHQPQTKLAAGNVVEEVVKEINQSPSDLVVIGAQGFVKPGRFNILKEKSLQIIRLTTRPVLLYRQKP